MVALLLVVLCASGAAGQTSSAGAASAQKQARAVRVNDGAIRLDGRLDEELWAQTAPLTEFIQKEPNEGVEPAERMEVRFAYDGTALYVGARMWSKDPSAIQAPLGRRDAADQAEQVIVSLDTYLDHRTAYNFGVTASGVRIDNYNPSDRQDAPDENFDPVWEARTNISEQGWTAELWIPFSQLRFNDSPRQVWGLNIHRFTPTLNEDDYWVLIPRTVTAWASRFGELRGLDGVRPTRRLELVPYIGGSATATGNVDAANPFQSGRNMASRVGADVKMGLGPNLTLDMAVNPDFGQVEADPAEVNLTAFETVFPEKRPFFTEGAQLLNLGDAANLFNSRRIGQKATGPAKGDYVDYPASTTILMAGKITGRTASGTSVGILGTVTDEESARISNIHAPGIATVRVSPITTYGLSRIQQQFGRYGSTASVMFTEVHRDLKNGDPLARLMPRNALGYGSDAVFRLKGGEYELTLLALGNFVSGEAAAIEQIQRSSVHYFQRPDRQYSRLDPTRTSIYGYKSLVSIERRSGRHWLWDTTFTAGSPAMESNDIGRTISGDSLRHNGTLRYRETRPGTLFRNYSIVLTTLNETSYDGDLIGRSLRPTFNATFRNFWTATAGVTRTFRVVDMFLTRGGPLMGKPAGWTATATLGNRVTAQTKWSSTVTWTTNEDRGFVHRATGSFAFRPGPRWQLSIDPIFDHTIEAQQYVTTLNGGSLDTYGGRYIFAYIDRSRISSQIRMSFTLKPDVNLDVYAEPFATSGRYHDYGELLHAGGRARLTYGTAGTTVAPQPDGSRVVSVGDTTFTLANADFNVRSFRSNVVLRWEWRPGSTLYLVWQQNRSASQPVGTRVGLGDLFGSLTDPGSNVFAIKTSFWMPVR